ncbi:hypothetical protein DBR17_10205 [Sphingomonas sp. HMWF008]|nr:hypothetical protein DBR17_10205 [Sphingomonas sp. HMWF008]
MIVFVVAAIFASNTTDAVQSNWKMIGRGKSGVAFYAEISTLERLNNSQIRIWTRRDQPPASRFDHEKVQITFDCQQRTSRYDAAVSYRSNGTIAKDDYILEANFLPVIPNSADWQTMIAVCSISKPTE